MGSRATGLRTERFRRTVPDGAGFLQGFADVRECQGRSALGPKSALRPGRPAVVRDDLGDDPPGFFNRASILTGACDGDEGLPQGPSASTTPGVVVKREFGAERSAAVSGELCPGHHEIAGGVAYSRASEINDRTKGSVLDEQIARGRCRREPIAAGRSIPTRVPFPTPRRRRRHQSVR